MFRPEFLFGAVLALSVLCAGCNGGLPQQDAASQLSAAEAAVRKTPTADAYIDLSMRYFQTQNFSACITAATEAIRRKPDSAIAYNNLAACYGALRKWDEEIVSAHRALDLSPDFQLARNNLKWAESQKRAGN